MEGVNGSMTISDVAWGALFSRFQLPAVSVLLKTPLRKEAAYSVDGVTGSIASVVHHGLFRPELAPIQLSPPSTLLRTLPRLVLA